MRIHYMLEKVIKDTTNLKLLANDKKFMKLVEMEKRIIDNQYKEFLEQKDNRVV